MVKRKRSIEELEESIRDTLETCKELENLYSVQRTRLRALEEERFFMEEKSNYRVEQMREIVKDFVSAESRVIDNGTKEAAAQLRASKFFEKIWDVYAYRSDFLGSECKEVVVVFNFDNGASKRFAVVLRNNENVAIPLAGDSKEKKISPCDFHDLEKVAKIIANQHSMVFDENIFFKPIDGFSL